MAPFPGEKPAIGSGPPSVAAIKIPGMEPGRIAAWLAWLFWIEAKAALKAVGEFCRERCFEMFNRIRGGQGTPPSGAPISSLHPLATSRAKATNLRALYSIPAVSSQATKF
jgi:hypothetical protein